MDNIYKYIVYISYLLSLTLRKEKRRDWKENEYVMVSRAAIPQAHPHVH